MSRQASIAIWFLFIAFSSQALLGDILRVTTWNLQPHRAAASTNDSISIIETAGHLRQLAPDVILLQRVPDWGMCSRLTQALKPLDYCVLVCSAFPPANAEPGDNRQVAILARQRGYFAWADPWLMPKESGVSLRAVSGSGSCNSVAAHAVSISAVKIMQSELLFIDVRGIFRSQKNKKKSHHDCCKNRIRNKRNNR